MPRVPAVPAVTADLCCRIGETSLEHEAPEDRVVQVVDVAVGLGEVEVLRVDRF
mgnify:CR=1 FL=1